MAQARLDVKVTGDASGALKAIQTVRAAGNEAAAKFREQSKEAIGAIVRSLNPIVLVGTAAATAIMGIGQKISDYFEEGREAVKKAGEELAKNAEAAGVTERAYQQLRSAAERAGVAQDEFSAKMQALKEGKETVSELVEEWGKLPEKIGLTTEAIERYQLEAAARRQKEEAADAERDKNMSAVTYEDELVGEFWARVHRGENADAVQAELVERRRGGWTGSGVKAHLLDLRLMSERTQADIERINREAVERNRREAEAEKRETEAAKRRAEEQKRRQAERVKYLADWKKADEDYIKQVEGVGGIENFALARAAYYMKSGNDPAKWDVAALRNSAAYRQEMERYNATQGRIKERKTATEIAAELAGKLYAGQQAAAKQAEEDRKRQEKANEEARKKDEADRKKREDLQARRDALRDWYREAKAEAANSYAGGYNNSFGLAFGGGDLIGAGRYRAVTRMTEAQKQLQVAEKLLEVNRQMNEKLKALEE